MQIIHTLLIGLEDALLNPFGDIPPATMSILQDLHSKGVRLALICRHSAEWSTYFLKRKRIEDLFSFLLAASGAQYVNLHTQQTVNLSCFSKSLAKEVIHQATSQQKSAPVALDTFPITYAVDTGRSFVFGRPGFYSLLFELRNHTQKPSFQGIDSISDSDIIPRLFLVGSKPLLTSIEKSQALLSYPSSRITPRALELSAPGTDLQSAYALAKSDFDLKDKEVLTFACSARAAGLLARTKGIAMKNASMQAIKAAWRTTKYNAAQNGIAYMINVLLMEKACVFRKEKPKQEDIEDIQIDIEPNPNGESDR